MTFVTMALFAGVVLSSANSEPPGDVDPIGAAIQKAEQLRRRGEVRQAYQVLYSVRNGQTGKTGAALVNLLGSVLQDLGRGDEAEQHYRRALRMIEIEFGPDDADLVSPLNDLGGLMMARGRLDEAAVLLERSLALRERHYSEAHPVVLRGLENLAKVRLAQKHDNEAEHLFERARQGWEDRMPGAPEAAVALNGLGVLAERRGNKERAATVFRDAIERWRPDEEPLLLAQVIGNLASVLPPDEALAQYSRAIALVEKHGGLEHPLLARLLDGHARCLHALHQTQEARAQSSRANRVRKANTVGFTVDAGSLK